MRLTEAVDLPRRQPTGVACVVANVRAGLHHAKGKRRPNKDVATARAAEEDIDTLYRTLSVGNDGDQSQRAGLPELPQSTSHYTSSGSVGFNVRTTCCVPRRGCFAFSTTVPACCRARIHTAPVPATRENGLSPIRSAGPESSN